MDDQKSQSISSSSSGDAKREDTESPLPRTSPPSFFGKHRLTAAISHLENQIKMHQGELEELETVDGPSIVCKELFSSVESSPDPLLPLTKGPTDPNWDRWFRGTQTSRSHKRWI